jgi:hypothetical protein
VLSRLLGNKQINKENEVRVVLPEEEYGILEWKHEGLPCVAVLNSALKVFEPKEIFSWHLSLIIDFEDLIENGMPTQDPLTGTWSKILNGSKRNGTSNR